MATELREGFQHLQNRTDPTEADVRQLIISRVLTAIGFSDYYRRPEQGSGRNRPDEICYVTEGVDNSGSAALIVEAKAYDVDFDKPIGGLSTASPDRQIQRYLRQHPSSGPQTIGVLTDGLRWRIYERTGPASIDIRFVTEYNFNDIAKNEQTSSILPIAHDADDLQEFVNRLCRECILEQRGKPPRLRKAVRADQLFSVFATGVLEPRIVLPHLLDGRMVEPHIDLAEDMVLDGMRKDAHDYDWEAYAYAFGTPLQSDKPTLEGRRVVTAAVRFVDNPYGLSRADTALCARTFAGVHKTDVSVILAYRVTGDNTMEARIAACASGQVAMTAPFDPELPTASAKSAIESVLGVLSDEKDPVAPERLLAPLEVAPLRQQFYKEVSDWTKRLAAGKPQAQREAVLRHLIRVMFAWILKEDGLIPVELFEQGFASARMRDLNRYHRDMLRFLFHDRLNVSKPQWNPHPEHAIHVVMEGTPFLNGSLFQEQDGDEELPVRADDYWNASQEAPGLFTILSRYHWTTDEHRPGESEQTLDPELLSNLFERLIAPIENDELLERQPHGTYYTPADVTAEMVKDALAAATRNHVPASVTDEQLLDLFGDRTIPLPSMSNEEQGSLAERVHALRIFDPAVGSGAFLFGCLTALRTALEKLEPDSAEPTLGIIREQLHGQDIHPLAAQITRLRLFIALKAADRDSGRDAPLPNLEARIVCADTLETSANPEWRPDHPGQLDTADPELVNALVAVGMNRGAWLDAHTEEEKQAVLRADVELRDGLSLLLREKGALASPELVTFAEKTPLFARHVEPARTDARLLFYENPWRGFDIVIGNPPYEALDESADKTRRQALAENKRYRTTNCGDLYPLFCETAIALANPQGGVVTMIVPLSIAFGQRQRTLRRALEDRCSNITLRHYNHMPDTIFNASPTVIQPMNGQRTTIYTAIRGPSSSNTAIRTTGLPHWPSNERSQCLRSRTTIDMLSLNGVDTDLSGQWARTPTTEISDMVQAIVRQRKSIDDLKTATGCTLGIPTTALYFIGVTPKQAVSPRSETHFTVADEETMYLVMAALNGHVAHGWWSVFGDGWHVKTREMALMRIPDAWIEHPQPAIELGKRLANAIQECTVHRNYRKQKWFNVNFHLKLALIEEIDRLHIEALGLPTEPLLTHLRLMRSNRSWDFSDIP